MNQDSIEHFSYLHQQRETPSHGMVNVSLGKNGFGVVEPALDADLESARNVFGERVKELSAAVAKVEALTRQLEELRKGNASNSYHVSASNGNNNCVKFNQEFGKLRKELLYRSRLAQNQSSDLETKKSLLNQKKSELVVIDEKIAQLQQRLAKKRHINQQLSYQMQSQALAGPIGLSNKFNSLRGTSGHGYKRLPINQRSTVPNIAAVEPIQRKPQSVDKTSEGTLDEEALSVYCKHDPKYQTLPPNSKFNRVGHDVITNYYGRGEPTQNNVQNDVTSPSITPTNDSIAGDESLPVPSCTESGVGSSISSGCSLRNNSINMIKVKELMEDRNISNTSKPNLSSTIDSITPQNHLHPTRNFSSGNNPSPDEGLLNNSVLPVPLPSSEIDTLSNTQFAFNDGRNINDDWLKSRRRPVVVDADMERQLSAPDDDMTELTQKHFPVNIRSEPQPVTSQKDAQAALANKPAITVESHCPVKPQSYVETKNSHPSALSCDVTDDSCTWDEAAPLEKVAVVEEIIEPSNVNQQDSRIIKAGTREGIEFESEMKCGIGKRKSASGLTRRVSFDPLALLLDAALEGELELVKKTASEVPDPSAVKDEGITALHNAICAGHLSIVRFLVEIGCDVNAQDSDGWTPLHCAASCNNLAMVQLLVQNGACIFASTFSDHETAAEKCEEDEVGYDECYRYLSGVQDEMGTKNEGVVYAVYDYDAQNSDEISFKDGDKVTIIRRGDDQEINWWWARAVRGQEGYVPRNLFGLYPRVKPKKAKDVLFN